jgi:hypothetical protein
MTALVADATLPNRLKTLTEPVEVVDETGRTLGYFQPDGIAPPGTAAARSPNTDEQLRELRKQRDGGLPLSEVLMRSEP